MDDVATKIIDILKKHMKEPRDDIGLNTALTDLKIESLDLAMIVFDIEDTFGIEIPYNANEEAADFKTVGSVVDRVRALIESSGTAPVERGRRLDPGVQHRHASPARTAIGPIPNAGGRGTTPCRRDRSWRCHADRHHGASILGRVQTRPARHISP